MAGIAIRDALEIVLMLGFGFPERAGGFEPLPSSEDVALVRALEAVGARIAWSAAPRVVTSSRHESRAPGGFGASLAHTSRALAGDTGGSP